MKAVPNAIWSGGDLTGLDIRFLAECHRRQTVRSRSQVVGRGHPHEVPHQLVRDDDGVEVARARTVWVSNV